MLLGLMLTSSSSRKEWREQFMHSPRSGSAKRHRTQSPSGSLVDKWKWCRQFTRALTSSQNKNSHNIMNAHTDYVLGLERCWVTATENLTPPPYFLHASTVNRFFSTVIYSLIALTLKQSLITCAAKNGCECSWYENSRLHDDDNWEPWGEKKPVKDLYTC